MTVGIVAAGLVPLAGGCAKGDDVSAPSVPDSAAPSAWTVYQDSASPTPPGADQLAPGELAAPDLVATGTFLPYQPGATAITYNPAVVPSGGRVRVAVTRTSYGMIVRLTAAGMVPRRTYGAHLHTLPCTGDPAAAGPHYQHQPSAGADAHNEIWLDFTADPAGAGTAVSTQTWTFAGTKPPRSLVIHDQPGMSGVRVACLTLPVSSGG